MADASANFQSHGFYLALIVLSAHLAHKLEVSERSVMEIQSFPNLLHRPELGL